MPNIALLVIGLIVALNVTLSSAHENERNWKPSGAEHEIVDNQASGWAWVVSIAVIVVAVLLAFH